MFTINSSRLLYPLWKNKFHSSTIPQRLVPPPGHISEVARLKIEASLREEENKKLSQNISLQILDKPTYGKIRCRYSETTMKIAKQGLAIMLSIFIGSYLFKKFFDGNLYDETEEIPEIEGDC